MTLSNLSLLSVKELKQIAQEMNITPYNNGVDKDSLLRIIFETVEDERFERLISTNLTVRVEATKFSVGNDEEISSSFSQDVILPSRYNESTVVIILRDPHWLYCYWDIRDKQLEEINQDPDFSTLFLKINRLRHNRWTGRGTLDSFEVPIDFDDLDRYIELPAFSGYYGVELGAHIGFTSGVIVRSNILDVKNPGIHSIGTENDFLGVYGDSETTGADSAYVRLADPQTNKHSTSHSEPGLLYGR